MKWLKSIFIALLVLAATGEVLGARRLSRRHDPPVPTLTIAEDRRARPTPRPYDGPLR
jgi:hypothetical protein